MEQTTELTPPQQEQSVQGTANPQRFVLALVGLAVLFFFLWLGFDFLKATTAPQLVIAGVAIVWGVGGVALLFTLANVLVESLSNKWRDRVQPYVFVGPAVFFLGMYLFLPTLQTLWQSFFDASSTNFIGLDNFSAVFTNRLMQQAFINNLIWLVVGTGLCVVFGLLIAVLADRSRFESVAKAMIFLPMAISFVGAGVIWRFIYAYAPPSEPQIGVLNALVVSFGGQPQAWLTESPWNTLFLIVVLVWIQTGFAMVIFSAALKGVPGELLEAARLDGASEIQSFFKVIIPYIQGTIITVTTTIAIFTLKIFDVVIVMTGGQYDSNVIATQFYREFFSNRNFGYGSAIAIVLFIAVIPVMFYNLRQLRKQEGF